MGEIDQVCNFCLQDFRSSTVLLRDKVIICGPCEVAIEPAHKARAVTHAAEIAMSESRGKGSPLAAMRHVAMLPDEWHPEAAAAVRYVYAHGKYPPIIAQERARARARAEAAA